MRYLSKNPNVDYIIINAFSRFFFGTITQKKAIFNKLWK
ncbi:hypothetical protein D1AOALGA4SA_1097 [Olavius algarvensis Delta 1 endosymbiont]|nr:hypothetical protein D1AOALGA4SA_1097 [Olavius algarvensis Delta 1 endosymbiont]